MNFCLYMIYKRKTIINMKRKRQNLRINLIFLPWHISAQLLNMFWIRIRISSYGSGSDFHNTNTDLHHWCKLKGHLLAF